ncbi:hypothetical protein HMPREF0645_2775 [Hallella bergensis DSM 17361]|uniref:Uncharacterized protein n=1 Tax=Hallella bergensis DSM 17361 TaxID=585502 RepID=D1Q0P0_9BACT|nr:hypothetical protein HMPREF0645_2775 [Hallella bergensis DSM 17361]
MALGIISSSNHVWGYKKNASADWLLSGSAKGFYLVTCYLEDLLSIS